MTIRIGIDLGGTKISGIVLDDAGRALAAARIPSPRDDYQATLTAIESLVAELEAGAGSTAARATVGIGTPGTCQPRLGRMKNCNSTWLNDRPLPEDLARRLGPRVRIANDADCFALSEAADGVGAGADTVFGVILGTGVGGGVVVHGRLLRGPNGLAGEWGHLPLPYLRQPVFDPAGFPGDSPAEAERIRLESGLDDRRCYCGRLNCIETFLSGPGLARTHAELWQETLTGEEIAAGGGHAAATFELYQHMLARSLAQVVTLLDPAVIVLGGGVSNAAGLYPRQQTLIARFAFSSVRSGSDVAVVVRQARWGDDSGVRGAARLWDAAQNTGS